jgi:hypothetical protein
VRDKRFITEHRGGSLSLVDHHLLAVWAADCAEHLLSLFAHERPDDPRPEQAIQAARAWANGEMRVGEARKASVAAHAAARACKNLSAMAAARAAGHAAATAHMADHALGPVIYGNHAVRSAAMPNERDCAAERERAWQIAHLHPEIYDLVLSVIDLKRLS